jgi:hypothetical protein
MGTRLGMALVGLGAATQPHLKLPPFTGQFDLLESGRCIQ